ncbi:MULTISPECIES: ribosome hibernation-promoting factor, HPF/YfiA family [Terrabacteria group]|uniref:ribosome hibernation-promoting factor, HPF/YfiA family n=1 Tax=Bacillati TaxID=1783272 RepID=UPI00193A5DB6|nr:MULTISPECIES: ribosome-associated translation inhibitor RaiA [Terrabacteria group]MBW9212283.1 ribosome-associated translation inhibitor RaiA [Trueperella sp. zg.1013]QRG86178.1 ribosome-associated translation inhibitor RaiA [Bulleidia sp. zg-1006]
MRFEIVGKNVEITKAMRSQIEDKLTGLEKYLLVEDDTIARVVARVYPKSQKVEITIPTKIGTVRAEVVQEDFYAALDLAIDKLEDQIRRQKTRLSKRHREHLAKAFIDESAKAEEKEVPVRTKIIQADKMSLDEAILQMELLGHSFYVYTDEETNKKAIVYQRDLGGYGLLEVQE